MKTYILSSDDDRYKACVERLPECIASEVVRICVTPENVGDVPEWFEAPKDRWCITMATVKALESAKDSNEHCLYFEDDAVFRDDFEYWYHKIMQELPDNWNQLFLGGQLGLDGNTYGKPITQSQLLLKASCVHRNHAVLTNKDSLQRVIDWYLSDKAWGSRHTCDWRILYLHKQSDFNVYIPSMGWLVGQGANLSTLDNIRYPDRWWDFTLPEYYLHSPYGEKYVL